ncbi:hypothetical protein BDC45DRAFT_608350 [Circinella umbellata]|nr:hypothetical protein BDC45DRAFT_608350 [Circinella umbellata]
MTIASIYKTCKWVLDGLSLVPDFDSIMMNNNSNNNNKMIDHITTNNGSHEDLDIFSSLSLSLSTAIIENSNSNNTPSSQHQNCCSNNHSNPSHIPAPLYQLWELCRQGYILCSLFNLLKPKAAIDLTLVQDTCKKQNQVFVYRFIIACREHLSINENDLFTLSEMYQDNAMGFSKVVNTLHKILTLLSERGILKSEYPPLSSATTTGQQHTSSLLISDNDGCSFRDKVIIELLHTERRYVEYLETTQKYAQELRSMQRNMISLDTLHHIFGNLDALIDFQLRFLMQVEHYAENPKENFGRVLMELEEAFSVYEPYCANMQHALDLVVQWAPQLSTNNSIKGNNNILSPTTTATSTSSSSLSTMTTAGTPIMNANTVVEPNYELPSLLIKPVQRVCKYPLLLQQLMNYTSSDWPHYDDLQRGLEAMERVASKVNETRRLQENKQRVKELKERVLDWKTITNVEEQCGTLLLHDRAIVHHKNTTKEVSIHLFEKVIMLCADVSSKKTKKKKDQSNSGPLSILGLIKINNVAQVDQGAVPLSLQIFWLKDSDLESFTLEYRNDEQVAQWDSAVSKLIRQQTRAKRLSNLVTCGLESYHDQEEAMATLSPTFLSYAFMNKLPVRGGYYDQIPELLEDDHDNYDKNYHDNVIPTHTSLYSYDHNQHNTDPHHQYHQQQHSSSNNYTNNSSNTEPTVVNNNQSYYSNNSHYQQQQQLLQQPGTLPSPHSPSCSTLFSNSRSRSSSTCVPPSPPQSDSSPNSPCVQTAYEISPNGRGEEQQKEQRQRRRITSDHHQQQQQATEQSSLTRGRSQSSPNISITNHAHSRASPYSSNTNNPHYYPSTTSTQHIIRKATTVKVKLYYSRQSAFVFYAPRDINYQDLRTLAERKTRMKGLAGDFIKYRDDDGDFITIHCDEDIIMAFDSAPRSDDAINLFILTTPTEAVVAAV